jgi:hypothetical protein
MCSGIRAGPLAALLVATPTFASAPPPAQAPAHVRVEDAVFPRTLEVPGASLRLAGAGLFRWKYFVKVYAAAWYEEGGRPDGARRLEVRYLVPIDGRDFGRAARQLLQEAFPPEVLAPLEGRMERLHQAYQDVRPGDRYALTYVPGRGLELALNGTPLAVIEGEDFARVYFSIWIGERPIDRGLRSALLGAGAQASR